VFKKLSYTFVSFVITIGIFLTLFEVSLYTFQEAIGIPLKEANTHAITWMYLLEQKYVTLIDLDVYTIHEERHLLDVKRLLNTTFTFWLISIGLIAFGLIIFKAQSREIIKGSVKFGLIIIFLLVLASIDFTQSFHLFHSFFFNPQTWVFPDSSMLIKVFPLVYFQQFFIVLLASSFVLFIVLWFLAKR